MNRLILWLLLLIIFSACTVYKEYPIEVYTPGKIAVPPNTNNVAIVYRNFKYKGDTLQHYYKDNFQLRTARKDPASLDSILVNLCVTELAKNLKAQGNFNEIRIFPKLFEPHSGNKLPTMNKSVIQKLANTTNTELLISLETYSYFYTKYSATEEMPTNSSEVITAAVWAVYNPENLKLIERKTMIDTIFWNGYDNQGNYQQETKLPPRITALKVASQIAGENYSKRFFASWKEVKRTYSVPPLPDFTLADEYVQKGEWDNAIMLWKRYADDNSGKMAINARYNIAFAYEMKDDFITAEKWLNAAHQIATSYNSKEDLELILAYLKILNQRKKEIELLNEL